MNKSGQPHLNEEFAFNLPLEYDQWPRSFRTTGGVRKFAEMELKFWETMRPVTTEDVLSSMVNVQDIESTLRQIILLIEGGDPTQPSPLRQMLTNFTQQAHLLSSDRRARYMRHLLDQDINPSVVAFLFLRFINSNAALEYARDRNRISVAIEAISHEAFLRAGVSSDDLQNIVDTYSTYREEWGRQLSSAQQIVGDLNRALEAAETSLSEMRSEQAEEFKMALEKHSQEITKMEKKYAESLALQSPVEYWQKKANRHDKESTDYRRWFAGVLVVGGIVLGIVGYFALIPYYQETPEAIWPIFAFSILAAAVAWPLRLTSKLYLSHRHLLEDALERVEVGKTYLSLRDEENLTDQDRTLLLTTLFRQAAGGLVQDEGGLSLSDAIIARIIAK